MGRLGTVSADKGWTRAHQSPRGPRVAVLVVLGFLGMLGPPTAAGAAPGTITVSSTADDGSPGTLRWAIDQANAAPDPTTIELPAGTYALTACAPTSEDLNLSGDLDASPAAPLHLVGLTTGATISQTCPGERVLDVLQAPGGASPTSASLALDNVTITGGTAVGDGGGIRAAGDVALTGVTVSDNTATGTTAPQGQPGVAVRGGGVAASGTVTVMDGTFAGNQVTGGSGDWSGCGTAGGPGEGGGIHAATVNLSATTFTGNTATGGRGVDVWYFCAFAGEAGGAASGGAVSAQVASIEGSTFTGNLAVGGPGGSAMGIPYDYRGPTGISHGGAINATASLQITGSTLHGDQSRNARGDVTRAVGDEVWSDGTVALSTTTIGTLAGPAFAPEAVGASDTITVDRSTVAWSGARGVRSDTAIAATTSTLVNGSVHNEYRPQASVAQAPSVTLTGVTAQVASATTRPALIADHLDVRGSLLVAPASTFSCSDLAGTGHPDTTSGGGSVARDPAGTCGLTGPDDTTTDDPVVVQLSALGDHGGPTPTLVPWSPNPALDHSVLPCPTATDQRGVARPQGGGCDAGAVEVTGPVADLGVTGDVAPTGTVDAASPRHGSFTLTNAGPDGAIGAELRLLAAGFDPTTAVVTDGGSCTAVAPPGAPTGITCTWPDPVPAGATRTVAVDGTVPTDGRATDVTTVIVGSDGTDPNPADNEVVFRSDVRGSADLSVSAPPLGLGFTGCCWTVTVTNLGPTGAFASPTGPIRIRLTLPGGVTLVVPQGMPPDFWSSWCDDASPRVCTFTRDTPIEPLDPWTTDLVLDVADSAGGHDVTVTVLPGTTPDPDPTNDTVTIPIPVRPPPPDSPVAPVAVAGRRSATISWSPPPEGGTPVTSYRAEAISPATGSCTTTGLSCTITGLQGGAPASFRVAAYNTDARSWSPAVTTAAPVVPWSGSSFHPLPPARVLDSRDGTGGWLGRLSGIGRTLQVTGHGGVPPGATAVVMNLAVTDPTEASYLTVWPTGTTRPTAANLNFAAGQTIQNLVTVGLSPDGTVDLATAPAVAWEIGATTEVVADVVGYYAPDDSGDRLTPLAPTRLLDSRGPIGDWSGPLEAGTPRTLAVRGRAGIPATATAIVGNVTVTGATAASYLTLWPAGLDRPTAANVNFAAGETTSNLATIALGADGAIEVANANGAVHVVMDVTGYYDPTAGSWFHPTDPLRILDDRTGTGLAGPWGPDQDRALAVAGNFGIPVDTTAVLFNLTGTNGTAATYVTAHPGDAAPPTAASLLLAPGETRPNLVLVAPGGDGTIGLYNQQGSLDLVADLAGWFAPW